VVVSISRENPMLCRYPFVAMHGSGVAVGLFANAGTPVVRQHKLSFSSSLY
jgi:hypothetical protein